MSGKKLIEVRDVSMRYRVPKSRRRSLRESVFRKLLRRDEMVDIWALKEVSFDIEQGEALGMIGDNGAGKSTLCLLLSKIMEPTAGTVNVAGKVSALLTLAAGFQWDLTGRDNVFLNGIYLGFKAEEIRDKFDEILEFSELGEFIDMPVRTYSSGMKARLAFSIAAFIRPEILVIDELMGVGDRSFREKSTARMKAMIAESQVLVVVSHNMNTIRSLCSRVIWLDRGRVAALGPVEEVVSKYESR